MSTTIRPWARWLGGAAIVLSAWSMIMLAMPFIGSGRTLAVLGDGPDTIALIIAADGRVVEVRDGATLVRGDPGLARRLYAAGAPLVIEGRVAAGCFARTATAAGA